MIDNLALEQMKVRKQVLEAELISLKQNIEKQEGNILKASFEALRIDAPYCRVVWDDNETGKLEYSESGTNEEAFQILAKWLWDAYDRYGYEIVLTDDKKAVIPRWKGNKQGEWMQCRVWLEAVE